MATAIIDANALVGLLDDQDKWHRTAIALRDALSEAGVELVYLDCVINETISVVARRTREQGRVDQLNAVLDQLMRLIPAKDITGPVAKSGAFIRRSWSWCAAQRGN